MQQRTTRPTLAIMILVLATLLVAWPAPAAAQLGGGLLGRLTGGNCESSGSRGFNASFGNTVPVIDEENLAVNSANKSYNQQQYLKECQYDGMMASLAKQLIKQLSNSTINWIQTGFDGQPAFVQDPSRYMQSLSDQEFSRFLNQHFSDIPTNHPFKRVVGRSLEQDYASQYDPNYTLDNVTGSSENSQDFLRGDFSKGGWDAWWSLTQNPSNNPIGSYAESKQELRRRIGGRQSEEQQVLDWGRGIRSVVENGQITTPGVAVEEKMNQILGSDTRQLELADEVNEILGALAGQLTSQVISEGLASLDADNEEGHGFETNTTIDEDLRARGPEDTPEEIDEAAGDIGGGTTRENVNLALRSQYTEQSSRFRPVSGPENAVDGRAGGAGSTRLDANASTERETSPWWQIDLREDEAIRDVHIHRRPDATLANSLPRFRLFISDEPFPGNFNPLAPPQDMFMHEYTPTADEIPVRLDVNALGRYVRIQLLPRQNPQARNPILQLNEVQIFRNNPPEITLQGDNPLQIEAGNDYTDPGATAFDQSDEDTTGDGSVEVEIDASAVDTSEPGTYTVTYTATDSGGATATTERTVTVVE